MAGVTRWDARAARCQQGLDGLDFLLGEWVGEGSGHGASFAARLLARRRLQRTFVEVAELHRSPDGEVIHEDLCFYRWDEADARLRVTHLMSPGWLGDPFAELIEPGPGLRWLGGPAAPRVEFRPSGENQLQVRVWFPGDPEPNICVDYQRQ